MDATQTEAALREAARRYRQADTARKQAMDELRRWIIAADQAGISRNRIVAITDVARQTVYDALKQR